VNATQLVQQAIHTSMAGMQNGLQSAININAQNAMNLHAHVTQNLAQNQTSNSSSSSNISQLPNSHNRPPHMTQMIQLQTHNPSTMTAQSHIPPSELPQAAALPAAVPQSQPPNPPPLQSTLPPFAAVTQTSQSQNQATPPATTPSVPAQATNNPHHNQPHWQPHGGPNPHLHGQPILVPLGNPGVNLQQPASRVFKLQFDARRIICCSQDPKIVGWDFAAGDREIEEASAFFVGP
jgi:F-box and WD-40 domain protein 1/11